MTEFKRAFIAIHRISHIAYEYQSRRACYADLQEKGFNKSDFKFYYGYTDMARKPYSSGYAEAHKRAARNYNRRKRGYGLKPRGRPKKID